MNAKKRAKRRDLVNVKLGGQFIYAAGRMTANQAIRLKKNPFQIFVKAK